MDISIESVIFINPGVNIFYYLYMVLIPQITPSNFETYICIVIFHSVYTTHHQWIYYYIIFDYRNRLFLFFSYEI